MLIERMNAIETSNQLIQRNLETMTHQHEEQVRLLFVNFLKMNKDLMSLKTFFVDAKVKVLINKPMEFFLDGRCTNVAIDIRGYAATPMTFDVKTLVRNEIAGDYDFHYDGDGIQYVTFMCNIDDLGFSNDPSVGVYKFYKDLGECVDKYARKLDKITGFQFFIARICKPDLDDFEEGDEEEDMGGMTHQI